MLVTKLNIFIFFTLLFRLNGLQNQRFKCPNLNQILKLDELDEDFDCADSLFYDDQAKQCVAFEECPMIKDLGNIHEGAFTAIKDVLKGMDFKSLAKGDIFEFSKNVLTNLNLTTKEYLEKYEDEKDFDLIRDVLEENVGAVLYKYTEYLKILANPYIRRSSFIQKKCGQDTFCFLKYMLSKNKKQIKKAVTDFLPDLVSGLGDIKDELKKSVKEECKDDECRFSRTLIEACEELKGKIDDFTIPSMSNLIDYVEQLLLSKKSEK